MIYYLIYINTQILTHFRLLEKALETIKDDYDYILIDTPPSMSLVQINVLAIADKVIIPIVPETFAMKGLPRILKAINGFKAKYNTSLEIAGIVFMMVDYRTALHSEYAQQIKAYCESSGIHYFESEIKKSIRFADATASEGKPATLTIFKNNEIVKSYYEFVKELFV